MQNPTQGGASRPASRRIGCLAALLLALLAPCTGRAASCSVSAIGINFGTYNGTATTATASVTVNCTAGLAYNVGADGGTGYFGVSTKWRMLSSSNNPVFYRLYRDSARTQIIGQSPGTNTISGTGTGSAQTVYIYGLLVTDSTYIPGSFSDTVTITVFSTAPNATTTMNDTITVNPFCSISISALAFGAYTGAQLDGAANVSATCTNTTAYSIGLNAGQNSGGNYNWNMVGPGAAKLNYSLYQDAARSTLWGGTSGYDTPSGTGTGSAQTIPIYGRIGAGQYVAPGSYSDIVSFILYY